VRLPRRFVLLVVLMTFAGVALAPGAGALASPLTVTYQGHATGSTTTVHEGGIGGQTKNYGTSKVELSWSESATVEAEVGPTDSLEITSTPWHLDSLTGTVHYDEDGYSSAEPTCDATLSASPDYSDPVSAEAVPHSEDLSIWAHIPFEKGVHSTIENETSHCSAAAVESYGPLELFPPENQEPEWGQYRAAWNPKLTGEFYGGEPTYTGSFNYAYTVPRQAGETGPQPTVALISSILVSSQGSGPPFKLTPFPNGEIPDIQKPKEIDSPPSPPSSGGPPPPPPVEGKPHQERTEVLGGLKVRCPVKDPRCRVLATLTTPGSAVAAEAGTAKTHQERVVIGGASITVPGGHSEALHIKLSHGGLARLKRSHRLRATLTVAITTPGVGKATTSTFQLTLTAHPRHSS
jgi:hypothetical protein